MKTILSDIGRGLLGISALALVLGAVIGFMYLLAQGGIQRVVAIATVTILLSWFIGWAFRMEGT